MSFHTLCTARTTVLALLPALLLAAFSVAQAAPVNINTADAAAIAQGLKGIGLKRAQAIVDYRQKHGPFRNADELSLIKGIGSKVIQANRANIRTTNVPVPASGTARPSASAAAAPRR